MRRITMHVRPWEVEDALDGLLLLLPGGVHERPVDDEVTALVAHGETLPAVFELRAAAGVDVLGHREDDAPDDPALRLSEPLTIADRFHLRSPEDPPPGPGLLDIVLAHGAAFGTGAHPTTRLMLTWLPELPRGRGLADLGCGTGVLALAAAALGHDPVLAVDDDPAAIDAVREHAALNGAWIEAMTRDLVVDEPPVAAAWLANVPPAVHRGLGRHARGGWPAVALLSGFAPEEADEIAAAYHPLIETGRDSEGGWGLLRLERDATHG